LVLVVHKVLPLDPALALMLLYKDQIQYLLRLLQLVVDMDLLAVVDLVDLVGVVDITHLLVDPEQQAKAIVAVMRLAALLIAGPRDQVVEQVLVELTELLEQLQPTVR
jgi:hypothetical protein